MITNNFTIDRTYFNFGRVKDLDLDQSFSSEKFHHYFPML